MPFLPHLIESMIESAYQWFFIEGMTLPENCTNWCNMPPDDSYDHTTFLSTDGTTEILDYYAYKYKKIKIIRKFRPWNGKIEMVNSFLDMVEGEWLWEVDTDEFWKCEDIKKTMELVKQNTNTTCVQFCSRFFVGNLRTIVEEKGLGNFTYEWFRLWKWKENQFFLTHEPPRMVRSIPLNITNKKLREYLYKLFTSPRSPLSKIFNMNKKHLLSKSETKKYDIYMYHYAYVHETQIRFKEEFYSYNGMYKKWLEMNSDLEKGIYKTVEHYWGQYSDKMYGKLISFQADHPLKHVNLNGD